MSDKASYDEVAAWDELSFGRGRATPGSETGRHAAISTEFQVAFTRWETMCHDKPVVAASNEIDASVMVWNESVYFGIEGGRAVGTVEAWADLYDAAISEGRIRPTQLFETHNPEE